MIKSLPRTRLLSFLRADLRLPVRVWSMQHRDALLVARRTGYLSGVHDHAFAGDQGDAEDRARRPDRTSPYGWMRQRMAERMPCFSGDDPIWGWLKRPSTRPSVWRQSPGKATVLVSAIVPRHRILLSDFDDWHAVLNDWHLSRTEAEDAAVEAVGGATGAQRRDSWLRIFEVGRLRTSEEVRWRGQGLFVQACIDRIHLGEIVQVFERSYGASDSKPKIQPEPP